MKMCTGLDLNACYTEQVMREEVILKTMFFLRLLVII